MADGEYKRLTCSVAACGSDDARRKGMCDKHYRRALRATHTEPVEHGSCAHCQSVYEIGRRDGRYCSTRCKTRAWRLANPERYKAMASQRPKLCNWFAGICDRCGKAHGARRSWSICTSCVRHDQMASAREAARFAAEAKHNAVGLVTECKECQSMFCPLYGSSHASLCKPCADARLDRQKRAAKRHRKALQRGAAGGQSVCREKVFERDGWLCRLCGVDTPKELSGTCNRNAPELDHIVPVSRGGLHTYENTQCLCRACNGWKAARTMDEAVAALRVNP